MKSLLCKTLYLGSNYPVELVIFFFSTVLGWIGLGGVLYVFFLVCGLLCILPALHPPCIRYQFFLYIFFPHKDNVPKDVKDTSGKYSHPNMKNLRGLV